MKDILPLLPYIVAIVTASISAWFAWRGIKRNDNTASLSNAANLYSDYADKQEKRADKMEAAMAELKKNQEETDERVDNLESENKRYRDIISEVVVWLTELVEWEAKGYPDPAPRVSLSMVLAHLTAAIGQVKEPDLKKQEPYYRPHTFYRRPRNGPE